MPIRSAPAMSSYVETAYLNHYDSRTLKCLVRHVGEGKAVEILEGCRNKVEEKSRFKKNHSFHMIKEGCLDLYVNLTFLKDEALKQYPHHKGAAKFVIEANHLDDVYHKPREEVAQIERSGNGVTFGEEGIRMMTSIHIFLNCYYMAWIYLLPQRERIVKEVNRRMVDPRLDEYLISEPILNIPPQVRSLDRLNKVFQWALTETMGRQFLDKINEQAMVEKVKLSHR